MTRGRSRLLAAALLQLAALGIGAGSALATDDYTLPFYDPAVTLSYGVDRDPALGRQLDWTGQVWNDGQPHYGRVYDQHTGVDYPMALRSAVAAARDGTVVDVEGGYGTTQFGSFGNFVRLRHADGRHTLYYHLASATEEASASRRVRRWRRASSSGGPAAAEPATGRTCISRCWSGPRP